MPGTKVLHDRLQRANQFFGHLHQVTSGVDQPGTLATVASQNAIDDLQLTRLNRARPDLDST